MIASRDNCAAHAGAPGVGAVGGEKRDAGAGRKAQLHEHALHAPDHVGRAAIGDRSARPAERRPLGVARQRPQGLFARRRKRIERIAHSSFSRLFCNWPSLVPMFAVTLAQQEVGSSQEETPCQQSILSSRFRDRLSLPLIAAPMFLVSGVRPCGGRLPQRRDRFVSHGELPQSRTTRRVADGYRHQVEGAFGCKRQTVSTGLRQPDRASLQCAAGAGSAGAAAAPARNGDHLGRIAGAGDRAVA